ncbi:MAG: hypothetical protein R3C60_02420 [Parvularculaceae bacterium]
MVALSKEILEFAASSDPDQTLMKHIAAAAAAAVQRSDEIGADRPINLLLAGYFGAGNVGSDMRANEIVRQISYLLGDDMVTYSALALTDRMPSDVLGAVKCLPVDDYVPKALSRAVFDHDGVIACEGSMFKSKFSNVLSAVMAGALGIASRSGKLSIGYGAEVAAMDNSLSSFVSEHASGALIMCRNEASRRAADAIGLRATPGADTAWTFDAAPKEKAAAMLRKLGWNGSDEIVTICPSNPFWWPVRANPVMALEMQKTGRHRELSYGSVFFHAESDEIAGKYNRYIQNLAFAMNELRRRMNAFPLLVGMERVDEVACRDLAERMDGDPVILMGYQHPVRDVVGLLRLSSVLISSRFHALVGAMPGCVRSIGIAIDERVQNLLGDADQSGRIVAPDDDALGDKIIEIALAMDADDVARASAKTVGDAVVSIGEMGIAFTDEIIKTCPDFPVPSRPRTWESHIPPLPHAISELLN